MRTFGAKLFVTQTHPTALDWSRRVVRNGGSIPSQQTIKAISEFCKNLQRTGLLSKMKSLSCFPPDNLMAAITPLIVGGGFDPWQNHNFVASDLNIHGLKGDGQTNGSGTKYLTTGIFPANIWSLTNGGGTGYLSGTTALGSENGTIIGDGHVGGFYIMLTPSFQGTLTADFASNGTGGGRLSAPNPSFRGYLSMNRTAADSYKLFRAGPLLPHATVDQTTNPVSSGFPNFALRIFCRTENDTPYTFLSERLSFVALHDGLTEEESLLFYTFIHSMRQGIGGGYAV